LYLSSHALERAYSMAVAKATMFARQEILAALPAASTLECDVCLASVRAAALAAAAAPEPIIGLKHMHVYETQALLAHHQTGCLSLYIYTIFMLRCSRENVTLLHW
jgi:hypothetical protein